MSASEPFIEIREYDPEWKTTFEDLAEIYRELLGELALAIEHVGSTSVVGLAAKPIIDIDIVMASRSCFPQVRDLLSTVGYYHQGDLGVKGREAFDRKNEYVPLTQSNRKWPSHHLYVCPKDSQALQNHLAFRDHLRQHPEVAREYKELKRALAKKYKQDRKAYTEGKGAFIREILSELMD